MTDNIDKNELKNILNILKEYNDNNQLPHKFTNAELKQIAIAELSNDHENCPMAKYSCNISPEDTSCNVVADSPKDYGNTGHGISYSPEVLSEFKNPQGINFDDNTNKPILNESDNNVFVGRYGSMSCGDITEFFIKTDDNLEVIEDVRWNATGCASCIVSCSMAYKEIKGKNISDINLDDLSNKIQEYFNLPLIKKHCSMYPKFSLIECFKQINNKKGNEHD